ncbi:3'-5' DNA helicase [Leucoagaricus gongylophorus]
MKLKPDLLETKHWFYPLNKPKRDYQYNIVKNSLFENTIISVPTGLGKTFIAGVIMLNYYRWFPEGKVVFVAPTKPLVSQQIEASHNACGIPGTDAAEMTGETYRTKRERLWREKRVFYMTPQTLMNDLATRNCDAMDIILLVVDEAHKATGDYAYNQIVRWMMAKNPHFRLIALTATPGSNPAAVQNLVDGLHISHIEIRDENSIDLRPYLHKKKIEQHCIRMSKEIIPLRDSLAELMDTYLKPLKSKGIMWPEQQAIKLHPYTARGKIPNLEPSQRGYIGQLNMLGNLAQVMGYLLEGTIGMAYSCLKEVSEKDADDGATKNQQAQSKKLRESELFKKTIATFEACKMTPSGPFPRHPKLDMAIELLPQQIQSHGIRHSPGSC